MNLPLEGSREVYQGIIVSMVPDVCLTPSGSGLVPIPYTIWCLQADAANLANSVRQAGDRSHAVFSIVLHCYGDEPGVGGGVNSGTAGADCTPMTWSSSVRTEGRNMVRHMDLWWMNHKNTCGRLYYTRDMEFYPPPPTKRINPQIGSNSSPSPDLTVTTPQAAQLTQASAVLPFGGGEFPPLPPSMVEGTAKGLAGGAKAAGDAIDDYAKKSLWIQSMIIMLNMLRVSKEKGRKQGCEQLWQAERDRCWGLYPQGTDYPWCRNGCMDRAGDRAAICFRTGTMPSSPPDWDHLKDCLSLWGGKTS